MIRPRTLEELYNKYDIVHPELFGLNVNQAEQFHYLVSWIKENVGNVGRLNVSGKLYEIAVKKIEE